MEQNDREGSVVNAILGVCSSLYRRYFLIQRTMQASPRREDTSEMITHVPLTCIEAFKVGLSICFLS